MKSEVYSVSATDIEVWARIGVHPEEALIENCFSVSVSVVSGRPYKKGRYLNYEILVDVVKLVFSRSQKVLEDMCEEIINEISRAIDEPIVSVVCEIKKVGPAVKGIKVGNLIVKMVKEY